MSDREDSVELQENGSPASAKSMSPSPRASRSASIEVERKHSASPQRNSRSRSHSYSRTYSRRHGSYSRSRSRSHSRRRPRRYSRSRSHSAGGKRHPRRSYSPRYEDKRSPYRGRRYDGGGGGRYNNRSYYRNQDRSGGRRQYGNRSNRSYESPSPSHCLGVFGLSLYTQETELKDVFSKYGHIKDVQVVYDAQTGRSRGFAFIYYDTVEEAESAKEGCNGIEIDGRKIRVDFSVTQRAHTPTPGIYMGKPSYSGRGGGYRSGGGGGRRNYRDRSPSPYYRRYSRSRSASPRRYGYY